MNKERRAFEGSVEIRQLDDGKEMITGYAIVFNSESRDLGGFKETIKPEAMRDADVSDVVALFNHDNNLVLGRTPDTLTLTVDEHGVRYEIIPPETTTAKDLMESINRGDVRGSSFAFSIAKGGDEWAEPTEGGGLWKRTISSFGTIYDVSPVTRPAYEATDTTLAKRELGVKRDEKERTETEQLEIEKQKHRAKVDKDLMQLTNDLAKRKDWSD